MSYRVRLALLGIAILSLTALILTLTLLSSQVEAQTNFDIITVFPPSGAQVEEGENSKVTVVLTHSGTGNGLLTPSLVNGTARSGDDFGPLSADVDLSTYLGAYDLKGNKTATITVPIVWDYVVEGDETFQMRLSLSNQAIAQGYRFPGNATTFNIPVTITERSKYLVSLSASQRQATEGNNLVFKLNVENTGRGTVAYKIRDDSDADTGDYTLAAGTLAINANSEANQTYTITVPTIDDNLVEAPRESVILELSKPAGNPAAFGNLEFPDRDGDGRPDTRLSFTAFINDNEGPLWAEAPDVTVAEGGEAHVTLTLERALLAGEQVAFFANVNGDQFGGQPCAFGQDDFAQPNADYPLSESAEYVIRGGEQSAIIVVPTSPDNLDELDECFYFRFVAYYGVKFRTQSGQFDIGSNQFLWPKVTITDDDPAPELHYGHPLVVEPDYGRTAKLRYPVNLTAPSGLTVSVDYADGGGGVIPELNATSGTDYTPITAGTLTFKPGQVRKYVEVEVLGDWLEEPDERVYVRFSNPVNACLIPGANCQGQLGAISIPGIIENDDRNLKITITPDDDRVQEGEDINFRVKLSHPIQYSLDLPNPVLFGGTADETDDYTHGYLSGVGLNIQPGQTEQTISVTTIADNISGEGLETVTLPITAVRLGGGLSGGAGGSDCGEIFGIPCSPDRVSIDVETPTAYILDGPALSVIPAQEKVSEGRPFDFRVALSEPAAQDVTFTVKSEDGAIGAEGAAVAEDGADYTALAPQPVTIPAGQTDGGTYSIATHQDQADEPDHLFTILLESVTGVQVDEGAVAGVIRDDDPRPTLSIADAEADEGGALEFAVTLSGATERTVTVRWVTEDGTAIQESDYHGGEHFHSVIFAPGETAKTIAVHSLPDTDPEPDETFRVQLADAPGARFADATAVGTITNDDGTVISIADAAPVTETEGATPQATFTITMAPARATPVTVQWETMDGSGGQHDVAVSGGHKADGEADYTAVPSTSVTFAPGETVKQVSTTVLDDDRAEGEENFRAIITSVSDSDIKVMRAIAFAPIVDDDAWHIWIDESTPAWVDEGTGANKTVTVKLKRTDASVEESKLDPRFHTEFEYIGCFVTTRQDDDWPFLRIPTEYGYYGNQPGDTDAHVNGDVGFRRSDGTDFGPECHERTESRGFVNEGFGKLEYEMSFELTVKGDAIAEENETFTFLLESTTFGSNRRLFDPVSGGWQYVTITIVDDETPQASIADAIVVEDDGSVDLTVSLNKAHAGGQSVHVSMVDGTAYAWQDYQPMFSHKVEFPAGATTATVNVPIVDDDLIEGSETFTVKLSLPSGGLNIHPAGEVATVTIIDDAADSRPRLTVPDRVVEEGDTGDLVFRLNPPVPNVSAWASTIQWYDESPWPRAAATEGDDYAEITGNAADAVAVSPEDTEVTAAISTVEDTLIEGDEYFGISITWNNPDLHQPKFDGRQHGQIGGRLAMVVVRDDDLGSVTVDPIAATVAENLTWTSPAPTSAGNPFGDVYWSVEGADAALFTIDPDTGLLTLPAQNFEVPADQDVDNVYEVTVRVTDEDGNTAAQGAQVEVTNVDEVLPVLTIGDATVAEGGAAEFTVTLSEVSAQAVTVEWTTGDDPADGAVQATADTDYTAVTTAQTATIPVGETEATIEVQTTQDSVDEEDETFTVTLSSPVNATLGDPHTGTGTITDDDALPVLTIGDASVAEGGAAEFTVTLDAVSGREVTVMWTTGDDPADGAVQATADTDYTAVTAQTATIAAGSTTATIEVQTTDDRVDEENETFIVTLASPVNATLGSPVTGTGTITDDDTRGITISAASDGVDLYEEDESATTDVTENVGTYTVALDSQPTGTVTIQVSTRNVFVALATPLNLEFTASDWAARTVTVTALSDQIDNPGDQRKTMVAHTVSASGTDYADETAPSVEVTVTDDDDPPTVTIGDASVAEGGAVEFTVSLGAVSGREVSVEWTTGDDPADGAVQAVGGTDYTAVTTAETATISAGSTTATIEVQTTEDSVDEEDETFVVTLSSPVNATLGDPHTGTGTITDDDALPVVTVGDASVAEGGVVEFTVTLGAVSEREVTVEWTTGDDTAQNAHQATADTDYTAVTTAETATIAAGSTTATVEVQTTEDSVDEEDETFVVTLASPVNATLGSSSVGTGTITDDDALPILTIGDGSVAEGGVVEFTVSLGAVSGREVTVEWTTGDDPVDGAVQAVGGTDYTAVTTAETATISAGSTTATIEVQTTEDSVDEEDETFVVTLSSPVNATLGDPHIGTGTITDDDALPVVTIGDASVAEGGVVEFTVSLGAVSEREVTVEWTTGDDPVDGAVQAVGGTDYTAVTTAETATISAGSTTATIEVQTTEDSVDEEDETFVVTLASPVNASLGSSSVGTGTITDDDALPVVTVGDASVAEGGVVEFTVTLGAVSEREVTVEWTTGDDTAQNAHQATADTDYTAVTTAETATIAAGSTTATVEVQTTEDSVDEEDETFVVTLASPVNATLGSSSVGTGTITDDDALPILTIGDGSVAEGGVVEFTVSLGAVSGREVTVEWTTGDDPVDGAVQAVGGTDYTAVTTAETATISAGSTTATIEVQTLRDNVTEADETFIVTLASPVNATLGSPSVGTGTITDDPLTITPEVVVKEDHDAPLEVAEDVAAAPTFTFTATLEGFTFNTDQDLTVKVGKDGDPAVKGTDYTAVSDFTITITGGESTASGDFVLDPIDDALDEDDETVTVYAELAGEQVASATLTITDDDDPPAVSVADAADVTEGDDPDTTTDMTFTVTLSAASGKTVSVPYTLGGTAAPGSDYTRPNPLALEIAAGDTTGSIVIPVRGDTVDETDETVEVNLGVPRNATLGSPSMATGVIKDDDEFDVPLVSFASTHYTATEGDTRRSVNVVVNASPAPTADLTVTYTIAGTAANGTDYAQIAGPVTVPVSGTADIAITVTDDMIDDDGETIILTLVDGTGFNLGTTYETTITIADDDGANHLPLVNITASYAAAEPVWTSAPSSAHFEVTLSEPLNQDVWIPIDLEFISAEESECVHWNGAERCAPEVMPGRSMVGPQYAGVTVTDCSALPRESTMCLYYPFEDTDETREWWEEVVDGNFVDYQAPYLLPIMAGRTRWTGTFSIRKDLDPLNEKFEIILAMDTPEWPGALVQPGYSTEAEVFVVDEALHPVARSWWAGLSVDERRNLLTPNALAASSPITRQLDQSKHLTEQYVPLPYDDTHDRLATVIGAFTGELVDAEMDADNKRVDLSSSQAW